jgi:hypothetical protein
LQRPSGAAFLHYGGFKISEQITAIPEGKVNLKKD